MVMSLDQDSRLPYATGRSIHKMNEFDQILLAWMPGEKQAAQSILVLRVKGELYRGIMWISLPADLYFKELSGGFFMESRNSLRICDVSFPSTSSPPLSALTPFHCLPHPHLLSFWFLLHLTGLSAPCFVLQLTKTHQRTVGAVWSVPVTTAVCVAPSDSSCSCRGRESLTMEPVSTPAPLDTMDREGRTSTAAWVRFYTKSWSLRLTDITSHSY